MDNSENITRLQRFHHALIFMGIVMIPTRIRDAILMAFILVAFMVMFMLRAHVGLLEGAGFLLFTSLLLIAWSAYGIRNCQKLHRQKLPNWKD